MRGTHLPRGLREQPLPIRWPESLMVTDAENQDRQTAEQDGASQDRER